MTSRYLFIARFLARCALIGARRAAFKLQLGKAPSCLYIFGRIGSRAPRSPGQPGPSARQAVTAAGWECTGIYHSSLTNLNMQNMIDLSVICILQTDLHIFWHIFCIFCIFFLHISCIFCMFKLFAYFLLFSAYYFSYLLSYFIFCILFCIFIDIFCIYMLNMQNIDVPVFCILLFYIFYCILAWVFCILLYIIAYSAYFNIYPAYILHILHIFWHILCSILIILHILHYISSYFLHIFYIYCILFLFSAYFLYIILHIMKWIRPNNPVAFVHCFVLHAWDRCGPHQSVGSISLSSDQCSWALLQDAWLSRQSHPCLANGP